MNILPIVALPQIRTAVAIGAILWAAAAGCVPPGALAPDLRHKSASKDNAGMRKCIDHIHGLHPSPGFDAMKPAVSLLISVTPVAKQPFELGTKHMFVAQDQRSLYRYACYVTSQEVLWKIERLE